jgi:hypothetical protein
VSERSGARSEWQLCVLCAVVTPIPKPCLAAPPPFPPLRTLWSVPCPGHPSLVCSHACMHFLPLSASRRKSPGADKHHHINLFQAPQHPHQGPALVSSAEAPSSHYSTPLAYIPTVPAALTTAIEVRESGVDGCPFRGALGL